MPSVCHHHFKAINLSDAYIIKINENLLNTANPYFHAGKTVIAAAHIEAKKKCAAEGENSAARSNERKWKNSQHDIQLLIPLLRQIGGTNILYRIFII